MCKILNQQSTILSTIALSMGSQPSSSPAERVVNAFSENQIARLCAWCGLKWTEQDRMPSIWHKLLDEQGKKMKSSSLQNRFSPSTTKDPDLNFQITDQLVRDFSTLCLGRGNHYDFDTCHHGISPFSIISLSVEAHCGREAEETVLALAS